MPQILYNPNTGYALVLQKSGDTRWDMKNFTHASQERLYQMKLFNDRANCPSCNFNNCRQLLKLNWDNKILFSFLNIETILQTILKKLPMY